MQRPLQCRAPLEFLAERAARDAPRRTRALDQRVQWLSRHIQGQLRSEHAFPADHAHFQDRLTVDRGHHRNESIDGKVDVAGRFTNAAQHFGLCQVHFIGEIEQSPAVFARQQLDQVIFGNGQGVLRRQRRV
jgi:hypothetical protein